MNKTRKYEIDSVNSANPDLDDIRMRLKFEHLKRYMGAEESRGPDETAGKRLGDFIGKAMSLNSKD